MATGSAHAHGANRPQMYRFGFVLFLLTESGIFVTVFSTRFLLAGLGRPAGLNQALAGALTAVALVSVLPALGALKAAARGDAQRTTRLLQVTMLLAVLLLAGIAMEWSALSIPSTSRFGSPFFTALGLHAAHVTAALLVLAGLLRSVARGRFVSGSRFALEAGIIFWVYLVAVWIVLYTVFYLL